MTLTRADPARHRAQHADALFAAAGKIDPAERGIDRQSGEGRARLPEVLKGFAMKVGLKLNRVGMTMEEATIVKWHRQPGESFKKGEALYDIETEKVTMEVEAPCDGKMVEVKVPEGVTDRHKGARDDRHNGASFWRGNGHPGGAKNARVFGRSQASIWCSVGRVSVSGTSCRPTPGSRRCGVADQGLLRRAAG